MNLISAILITSLLIVGLLPKSANCQELPDPSVIKDERAIEYLNQCRDVSQTLGQLEKRLRSLPPAEWLAYDTNSYCELANWVLYFGWAAYVLERDYQPESLQSLVDEGFLSAIPLNPLNTWQPMKVLEISNAFSPGDAVIQIAPIEEYSLVAFENTLRLEPLSFELGVYGAKKENGLNLKPEYENKWALTPEGVHSLLGFHMESFDATVVRLKAGSVKVASQNP